MYGRMLKSDLIKVRKSFYANADVAVLDMFQLAHDRSTGCHTFKLMVPRCHIEMKGTSFQLK